MLTHSSVSRFTLQSLIFTSKDRVLFQAEDSREEVVIIEEVHSSSTFRPWEADNYSFEVAIVEGLDRT